MAVEAYLRKIFMQSNEEIKLHEDYQKIFKPFYFTNILFFMRQYNLKNNTASPVVLAYYIALAFLVNSFLAYLLCSTLNRSNFGDSITDVILYSFVYTLYVLTFTLLTLLNLLTKETKFVLMAKLQEIGDVIENPEDTKILRLSTWATFGLIIFYYASLLMIKLSLDTHWVWQRGVFIMTTIIFEMEVVHVSFIIIYLVRKLHKWKRLMMTFQLDEFDQVTALKLEQLRSVFVKIIIVQCLLKKAFQAVILFHFIMTFFQSLIFVEVLILRAQRELNNHTGQILSHSISVYGWIVKGLLIEILLCVSCELFYMEIENIRIASTKKTSEKCSRFHVVQSHEVLQHFCKCIRRIIDNRCFKMTACCFFTLDAALPLRFIALIVTYIVVLLQFAFT